MVLYGIILFCFFLFFPDLVCGENDILDKICTTLNIQDKDQDIKKDFENLLLHIAEPNNYYNTRKIKSYFFIQQNWELLLNPDDTDKDFQLQSNSDEITKKSKVIAFYIYSHLVLFYTQQSKPKQKQKNKETNDTPDNQKDNPIKFQKLDIEEKKPQIIPNSQLPNNNQKTDSIKTNTSLSLFLRPLFKFLGLSTMISVTGYGLYRLFQTWFEKPRDFLLKPVPFPATHRNQIAKNDDAKNKTVQSIQKAQEGNITEQNKMLFAVIPEKKPVTAPQTSVSVAYILGTSFSLTFLLALATFFTQKEPQKRQVAEFTENSKSVVMKTLRICVSGVAILAATYMMYYKFT
jgi:hypothetical protein